jgi:hypothetical protein
MWHNCRDASEQNIASIIEVEGIKVLCLMLPLLTCLSWRSRQNIPPKYSYTPMNLQGVKMWKNLFLSSTVPWEFQTSQLWPRSASPQHIPQLVSKYRNITHNDVFLHFLSYCTCCGVENPIENNAVAWFLQSNKSGRPITSNPRISKTNWEHEL